MCFTMGFHVFACHVKKTAFFLNALNTREKSKLSCHPSTFHQHLAAMVSIEALNSPKHSNTDKRLYVSEGSPLNIRLYFPYVSARS